MTATPLLSRSLNLRWSQLTSYLPLLLPLIPALGAAFRGQLSGLSCAESQHLPSLMGLATLGVFLGLGLPALLDRVGWRLRKEVELLQSIWLSGLGLIQVAVLFPVEGTHLGAWLLVGIVTLLGAIPFGAEFQHRTLSGLLSQPAGRNEVLTMKTGVLGAAMGSLVLVYLLSVQAVGGTLDGGRIYLLVGAAWVAWGTGPLWSLITRGLLAGLVFSMAIPMLVTLGGVLVVGHLRSPEVDPGWQTAGTILANLSWFVLLPAYGLAGAVLTARIWSGLEAPDDSTSELAGVFVSSWSTGHARTPRPRHRVGLLLRKELQLQTVTWVAAGLMLLLAVVLPFVSSAVSQSSSAATYVLIVQGMVVLMAWATVLLAGATAIAEERRLGTLEGHLLLPMSRRAQWRAKLAVASVVSLVACCLFAWTTRGLMAPAWMQLVYLMVLALPWALLASSGCTNALRALLAGLVLVAASGVLVGTVASVSLALENFLTNQVRQSVWEESEVWIERARHLSESQAMGVYEMYRRGDAYERMERTVAMAFPLLVLPIGFVLWSARRNLFDPVGALARWKWQAVAGLTVLLASTATVGAVYVVSHVRYERSASLSHALDWLDLDPLLSPAEKALRRIQGAGGLMVKDGVQVRLRPAPADLDPTTRAGDAEAPSRRVASKGENRYFRLPLDQASRALLIERGQLPDDILTLLRREQP